MNQNASPKRILLIDDDPSLLELLSLRLGKKGFAVEKVSDEELAAQAVSTFDPDLILIDLNLNHRSGWEVISEITALNSPRTYQFIVLSGMYGGMPEIPPEYSGVVAGFLSKPFRFDSLLGEIRKTLRYPDEPQASHSLQ